MSKKITILSIMLLISLLVGGCGCEASFTTANYKDLQMASVINDNYEAVTATSTFAVDSPIIYVVGVLDNSPSTVTMKAEWYYLDTDPEIFIDSAEMKTEAMTTPFDFNLSKPDNGWPPGNYEVRLFINDKHKKTLEFEVK